MINFPPLSEDRAQISLINSPKMGHTPKFIKLAGPYVGHFIPGTDLLSPAGLEAGDTVLKSVVHKTTSQELPDKPILTCFPLRWLDHLAG